MTNVALAALIDDTLRRNEWAAADAARWATERGLKLTESDISNFRKRGVKMLVPDKVRALALGLQLPPYRVAVAMLSDLGIDIPLDVKTPEAAIEHDETISASARRSALAILRADRAER